MASDTATGDVVHVTSKGQATIPRHLRTKHGIRAPGRVRFVEDHGRLVVRPVRSVDEMHGILKRRLAKGVRLTDDLRRERREDMEHERDMSGHRA